MRVKEGEGGKGGRESAVQGQVHGGGREGRRSGVLGRRQCEGEGDLAVRIMYLIKEAQRPILIRFRGISIIHLPSDVDVTNRLKLCMSGTGDPTSGLDPAYCCFPFTVSLNYRSYDSYAIHSS